MRPGMASTFLRMATIGFLATIVPTPAGAGDGLPNTRLGTPIAPLLLLSRADVRADLRLSPEQSADAGRFIADLHARALAIAGRGDAAAISARRAIDDASRRWLIEKLDDAQRGRLDQLDLQWEGPSALVTRPVVAESLVLNPDQRTALSRAIAARNGRRNGGPPILADEAKLTETALGLLTPPQRERWHAMLGTPMAFQSAARETPARR